MAAQDQSATTRGPSGCPILDGWAPLAPDQVRDPYEALARSRREVPVFYQPELNAWFVTRHEDVEAVLRDTETFSSAKFVDLPEFPPQIATQLPDGHPLEGTLVSTDPPRHTVLRKRAQKAFTPRQAAAHEPDVRALANALIDGFIDHSPVDIVQAYCRQIPIRVIGPILGIPAEEAAKLYQWATEALVLVGNAKQLTEHQLLECGEGQVAFDRYVRGVVADRRRNLRGEDDLISTLITAEGDDGASQLEDYEIVGIVAAAIAAGSDSSATTMAHCVHSLLQDRSRWQEVVANPDFVENAVEETLRLRGAVRSVPRTTTRDVTVHGVNVPKGSMVILHLGSASRDEQVFEDDPEHFDLYRTNARRHLAFGKWTHFCIGAPLARMELRVGIQTLVERLPSLRLVPGHEPQYIPSVQVAPILGGVVVEWDR